MDMILIFEDGSNRQVLRLNYQHLNPWISRIPMLVFHLFWLTWVIRIFLVMVTEGVKGVFTVAVLSVSKGVDTLTLTVSVKGFQSFLADDGYFSPKSVMMAN